MVVSKIKKVTIEHKGKIYRVSYLYYCEGCKEEHAFGIKSDGYGGHHEFNLDLDNPTVSPSLLQNFIPDRICHSYIINGQIQYLDDCWHELKGKTITLSDYDNKNN